MHTGDVDANNEYLSEVWFGNGWFRPMGSDQTTKYTVNMVEGDIAIRLPRGRISASDIRGCFHVQRVQAHRLLASWERDGLIERRGAGRGTFYVAVRQVVDDEQSDDGSEALTLVH